MNIVARRIGDHVEREFAASLWKELPKILSPLAHSGKKTFIFLSLRILAISARSFTGATYQKWPIWRVTGLRAKYRGRHGLGKLGVRRQETRPIACKADRLQVTKYSYFICDDYHGIFQLICIYCEIREVIERFSRPISKFMIISGKINNYVIMLMTDEIKYRDRYFRSCRNNRDLISVSIVFMQIKFYAEICYVCLFALNSNNNNTSFAPVILENTVSIST